MLGPIIVLYLIFWGNFTLFSIADAPVSTVKIIQEFPFLSLSTLLIFVFLVIVTMAGVRLYLIIVMICIFLMIRDVSIFSCVWWPSVYLLWKHVQVLYPFFNQITYFLMLSCMSSSYILDIKHCQIYCLQMSYPFQ